MQTSSTRLSLSMAFLSRKIRLCLFRNTLTPHLYFFSKADSVCLTCFSLAANQHITLCFLFLRVLRCFNSPRALSQKISLRNCYRFGDSKIKGCMHLPWTYRSLPRPSSLLKPSYPSSSLFNIWNKNIPSFQLN